MRGRFISYLRVSTDKQGEHGYGIDAQRKAVTDFLNGGSWELVEEFVEVESGKRSDRPELAKALAACRKHKAKLVIAKLDRLARNVAFIANLMDSKVEFVCCDMPQATRLTIHVLAAVAEHEREMIAKRTKDGLAAAKARGKILGNPKLAGRQSGRSNRARKGSKPAAHRTGRPVSSMPPQMNSTSVQLPRPRARPGRPRPLSGCASGYSTRRPENAPEGSAESRRTYSFPFARSGTEITKTRSHVNASRFEEISQAKDRPSSRSSDIAGNAKAHRRVDVR